MIIHWCYKNSTENKASTTTAFSTPPNYKHDDYEAFGPLASFHEIKQEEYQQFLRSCQYIAAVVSNKQGLYKESKDKSDQALQQKQPNIFSKSVSCSDLSSSYSNAADISTRQLLTTARLSTGPSKVRKDDRMLSLDFSPTLWSVIVGKDRISSTAPGTNRLRVIVRRYLDRYIEAGRNRVVKSSIISEIESTIRGAVASSCHDGTSEGGAFIRYQDGRWWEVDSWTAREKIGRMFREELHTKYSSSSKHKRSKRRMTL